MTWHGRLLATPARRPGEAIVVALLAAVWLVCVPAALSAQEPDLAESDIDTAPVEVDGQVLFRVRGATSIAAETRAANISRRIKTAAADRSVPVETLRLSDVEGLTRIVAGDRLIMAILEADARLEQLPRTELAAAHLARVRRAIDEYRQARTPEAVARSIRDTGVATLAVLLAAGIVLLASRWLHKLIARLVERRVTAAVQIQSVALVRTERIVGALHQGLGLLVAGVLALLAFQYLSFSLSRFAGTRHLGNRLYAIVVGPLTSMGQAIVNELPNLVFLAVLFVVFRVALRVLRVLFQAVDRGAIRFAGFEPEWALPTFKIVRFAVIAFGLVVAYPYLPGSESAAFKGVSIFIGVLFSLGSSSAIANLIAGYMLIYRRVFRLGDLVKIGDVIGEVTESRLQVTRLRSLKNEEVVIPNSQILGGQVINYSTLARSEGLILYTQVGIGYETPWRQVEAMLLTAAERTPGILRQPPPFVLQRALADFAVTYELNVYCAAANQMLQVYSDLHRHIQDVFNEYGVQIMTPAYMADPPQPKVVPPDQWFAAPARPEIATAAATGPLP